MTDMNFKGKVGADGILKLALPLGPAEANREVMVTVHSAGEPSNQNDAAAQEEWVRFVERTAGSIPDPTFFRHEQGELQERDPIL